MTPMTKYAIIVATLTVAGAGAASALSPSSFPAGGEAPAAEKVRSERHGFGRHGPRGPRGAAMEFLRQADTDGDNALTQEEIDAFIAARIEGADTDGDGNVSLEEFQTIWLEVTNRPMVRAFQHLDTDGDAVVTTVEVDERFGNVVSRLDRNDDGKLDRADRRGRHGHRGGRRHDRDDRHERDDD